MKSCQDGLAVACLDRGRYLNRYSSENQDGKSETYRSLPGDPLRERSPGEISGADLSFLGKRCRVETLTDGVNRRPVKPGTNFKHTILPWPGEKEELGPRLEGREATRYGGGV